MYISNNNYVLKIKYYMMEICKWDSACFQLTNNNLKIKKLEQIKFYWKIYQWEKGNGRKFQNMLHAKEKDFFFFYVTVL